MNSLIMYPLGRGCHVQDYEIKTGTRAGRLFFGHFV